MEIIELLTIMRWLGIIMMSLIIVSYFLSAYWNIKLLLTTVWTQYSLVKIGIVIVSIGFVISYSYLLHNGLTVQSVDTALFGAMVIRPLLVLQGSFLAASARGKNIIAKHGGEIWTLRKYKDLLDG